jgi:hypothetical protein
MKKGQAVIHLDVFHVQVGVFKSDKKRRQHLKKYGFAGKIERNEPACFGSTHLDIDDTGRGWFSMVIKPVANQSTWAHECSHMADFLMDRLGIPTDVSNTEVRAYLVGRLFSGLEEVVTWRAPEDSNPEPWQ